MAIQMMVDGLTMAVDDMVSAQLEFLGHVLGFLNSVV
jgi:hypothetical protein